MKCEIVGSAGIFLQNFDTFLLLLISFAALILYARKKTGYLFSMYTVNMMMKLLKVTLLLHFMRVASNCILLHLQVTTRRWGKGVWSWVGARSRGSPSPGPSSKRRRSSCWMRWGFHHSAHLNSHHAAQAKSQRLSVLRPPRPWTPRRSATFRLRWLRCAPTAPLWS